MNSSVIQKSQLEGAYRLDAEYFQPEYLGLEKALQKTRSYTVWGDIKGKFITGPFGSEFNVENYSESAEYRYVRGKDVKQSFLLDDDNVYIPEKDYERLQKYSLRNGDILISVVGTLGNSAIVNDKNLPAIFSCKSTLFRTEKLNPYYLIAYLNSKYGQSLLLRNARGQVQTGLNISDLKTLLIFTPPPEDQKNVASIIKESDKLVDESKEFYVHAENLLLEELGLKDFKFEEDLSFVVNLSDVQSAHRADAEFFQPKYEKLDSIVKKKNAKSLSELFSISRGDFINPDYYMDKAKRAFLRIKELPEKGDISFDEIIYIDDNFPGKNLGLLEEGDLVFAGIGATLGKTARIPKELSGSFYSNNTVRFRLKKEYKGILDTHYLQIVFQSLICQWQFEQRKAQTGQAKIADVDLKTVLIPVLFQSIQQKIGDLVRQSHAARRKSKELLEEAKGKVEEMIERGGKN